MCTQGDIVSSYSPLSAGCLLFRRMQTTPPAGSDRLHAAISLVPFTHLMSPLIRQASSSQFDVDHDVVSLHPFSIDFRPGSSTETALSVPAFSRRSR